MSHVSILFYRECQVINKNVKVIKNDNNASTVLQFKDFHYFPFKRKCFYIIPWTLILWPWYATEPLLSTF